MAIHTGLGSNIDDICGRDWIHGGGDHGDPGNSASLVLHYVCFWQTGLRV